MPSDIGLPEILAGVIALSLNAYVLFGGADFGGGVWDLLATGPRRDRQRDVISHAKGLAIAKTKIVGASRRKIIAASFHLGPRKTKIMSSAKRAQATVMGMVMAKTTE